MTREPGSLGEAIKAAKGRSTLPANYIYDDTLADYADLGEVDMPTGALVKDMIAARDQILRRAEGFDDE